MIRSLFGPRERGGTGTVAATPALAGGTAPVSICSTIRRHSRCVARRTKGGHPSFGDWATSPLIGLEKRFEERERLKKTMVGKMIGLLGAVLLLWMTAELSPSHFWAQFLGDSAPVWKKAAFLGQTYLLPAAGAFCAIALLQIVQRLAMTGAPLGALWGLSVVAWSMMLSLFSGVGSMSRPGYIFGMATGVALSSQVYAVTAPVSRFGWRWPRVTFRWNKAAVAEINKMAMAKRANSLKGDEAR